MVFKVELLDCLVNDISDVVGADTLDQSVELERLFDSEDREDCIVLRAIANQFTGLRELGLYVKALNRNISGCWSNLSCQTLEGGGLASAIDTKKCEALTIVKTETCLSDGHNWLLEGRFVELLEVVDSDAIHLMWVFHLLS